MYQNPNRVNDYDCATACCYNPDCFVVRPAVGWRCCLQRPGGALTPAALRWVQWQQDDAGRKCLHGGSNAVCTLDPSAEAFNGGVRTTVPPLKTSFVFSQQTLDDSQWRIMDVPHDVRAPSSCCAQGCAAAVSLGCRLLDAVCGGARRLQPGE
jgi:hypothetical protein